MSNKYVSLGALFIALALIFAPFIAVQSQYLVAGNISWLLIAAERLLSGQSLAQNIYETNPPLSILIYTPHVIFSKIFGIPLTVGATAFTTILVIISALAVKRILKHFAFLEEHEKTALLLGYIVSITIGTIIFFSEREHLIILGLIPFMLCQFAINKDINISKPLLITVMIVGSICILIKPHYGLLPSVFILARIIKNRRFNIFTDPDFLSLACATISYIGIVFLIFPDYASIIFPDVLDLYATVNSPLAEIIESAKLYIIFCIALLMFELFQEDLEDQKKSLLLFLYFCGLLCLVPYFVQMKGFYNHIFPTYAFFLCALTLSIYFRLAKLLKRLGSLNIVIITALILIIANSIGSLNRDYPKQSDIPNLPLAEFLEEECPAPCTFFAFHGDIEIINPTAAYMGYTHASRFPSFWWLPKILSDKTKIYQKHKYMRMVAEDLENYKPSVILLAKDLDIADIEKFNFIEFFSQNQNIKNIFSQHYHSKGVLEFDRAEYFKGTTMEESHILKYEIYNRI